MLYMLAKETTVTMVMTTKEVDGETRDTDHAL